MTDGAAILGVRHTAPDFEVPAGACDCHVHVFGTPDRYPFYPGRAYTSGPASPAELSARLRALHLQRVVIVQPSIYHTDNRCTLDAIAELGSVARGVAVIDSGISDDELQRLHAGGIRGVRVNVETYGGNDPVAAGREITDVSRRIAPLGWHVQIFASRELIAGLYPALLDCPTDIVIDHFGGVFGKDGLDQPGMSAMLDLIRRGKAYIKLASPRRRSTAPGFADLMPIVRALADANPDRLVWGSDWPHPGAWPGVKRVPEAIEPFHPIDDGHALNLINAWIGNAVKMRKILTDNPARLYGF